MRHHDHVGIAAVDFAHHFEIAIGSVLLRREIDLRGMRRLLCPHRVRRAGHALQRQCRIHLHRERQFAQRLGAQQLAPQAVAVAIAIRPQRQHLRVNDLDPLLRMGLDRKHAGFEQIAAGPFQQAGIALLAQNRLVNFAGPLFLDDVGLDQDRCRSTCRSR